MQLLKIISAASLLLAPVAPAAPSMVTCIRSVGRGYGHGRVANDLFRLQNKSLYAIIERECVEATQVDSIKPNTCVDVFSPGE
jgi:hypothetical protein